MKKILAFVVLAFIVSGCTPASTSSSTTSSATTPAVTASTNPCATIAGTWVMDSYTMSVTSAAGSINQPHPNKGKTLTLNEDCTYVEDYSTEVVDVQRVADNFAARGIDVSQLSSVPGLNVDVANISCSYQGQNIGTFEMDYLNTPNDLVKFTPAGKNNITGSCTNSPVGMQIDGTHFTPGVGQTAVTVYNASVADDVLTMNMMFVPQTGTEVNINEVYHRG